MENLRVLLVEDDDVTARAFVASLEHLTPEELPGDGFQGVRIDRVSDQSAADVAGAANQYDFVILSLKYPPLPGAQPEALGFLWLPKLRGLQPKSAIVIWSAYVYEGGLAAVVSAIRDHGADEVIPKDVRFDEFIRRLRSAWQHAASRRGLHYKAPLPSVQLTSCFISYSTKDQEFAERLHLDLRANGIRCWFAPHDMQGGKKLHEQIDEAIRLSDRLLLILSEHSMSSEWVKTEIACARQKELRDRRKVLFPISLVPFACIREWKCFDADTGKDSAREIREYYIPDFSGWRNADSYCRSLELLSRDLMLAQEESS
jgi:CheY-like chemotaxis protein